MESKFPYRRLILCSSCGNKGMMDNVASYHNVIGDQDEQGCPIFVDEEFYQLFCCPICDSVILIRTPHYDPEAKLSPISEPEYCYPDVKTDFLGVPDRIRTAFNSACATKGIDVAICLLSLRRTLEMICKDKGAVKGSLEDKIEHLASESVLPSAMTDICTIIRLYGNDGAHGDEVKVTKFDLDRVIKYVSTIIEYLYSLPARVSLDMQRLDRQKTDKESAMDQS